MNVKTRIDLIEKQLPDPKQRVYTYFHHDNEPEPEPLERGDEVLNVFVHFISPTYGKLNKL